MKNSSDAFVFGKDIELEDIGGGIRRQMLGYNDSLMVVRVEFEEGAEGYVHAHPHSQVSYVESGEFDVFVDGERKRLGPGDSFCVQPNLDHGAVCRKPGVLLDVFNPAREDFLEEGES
ncbi:MAG: cupin domain-containing protein [Pseudomonadota bacterium]